MRFRFAFVSILSLAVANLASGQTSQPTTAPVDATTPKGALKSLAIALDAGDSTAIHNLVNSASPMEDKLVGVMSDMAVTIAGLNKAMVGKFGKEQAAGALGGDPSEMLKQSLMTIDGATEKIDGESATVSISPNPQGAMSLKKIGGLWKVSVADQTKGLTAPQVDENVAMMGTQMKTLHELTADISAGKYATALDAAAALRGRMGGPPPTTAASSSGPAAR